MGKIESDRRQADGGLAFGFNYYIRSNNNLSVVLLGHKKEGRGRTCLANDKRKEKGLFR